MRKLQLILVASLLMISVGCTRVQHAAVTGGVLGAMTGGIIGYQSGETAAGMGIGAGVGALVGALAQDYADHVEPATVCEYRPCYRTMPPPPAYRARPRCVHVRPRKKVRMETSRDRRVWVPEHYAGGRLIEGHWETVHVVDRYWRRVR